MTEEEINRAILQDDLDVNDETVIVKLEDLTNDNPDSSNQVPPIR